MLPSRPKPSSSNRRRVKVLSLGLGIKAMRPCKNYTYASYSCRVSKGSTKYIDCVRTRKSCDLALINLNK